MTKLSPIFVFITIIVPAFTTPTPAPTPRGRITDLNEAARRCAAQEKLFNPADGKCYQPASVGPCDEQRDEFFILDTTMTGWFGRCARKPCRNQMVKWTDGNCYDGNTDRRKLCPTPGHIVEADAYGIGECVCDSFHAKNSQDPDDQKCYQLYVRGPCPEKAVLVPRPNGKKAQGVCAWDPCHQYQQDGQNVWLYWEKDGRCHQSLTPGLCDCDSNRDTENCGDDYRFTVDPLTLKPNCVTNNKLNLTPDARCNGCQTTKTEQFDRRILYGGGGS